MVREVLVGILTPALLVICLQCFNDLAIVDGSIYPTVTLGRPCPPAGRLTVTILEKYQRWSRYRGKKQHVLRYHRSDQDSACWGGPHWN